MGDGSSKGTYRRYQCNSRPAHIAKASAAFQFTASRITLSVTITGVPHMSASFCITKGGYDIRLFVITRFGMANGSTASPEQAHRPMEALFVTDAWRLRLLIRRRQAIVKMAKSCGQYKSQVPGGRHCQRRPLRLGHHVFRHGHGLFAF